MHPAPFKVGGGDAKEPAMKRLAIVVAALVLSTTLAPAGVVHRRQKRQHARIQQGVRSGEVTPEEAAKLKAEQQTVQADREKAAADGKVTGKERRTIRPEQNQASRDILRKKHNRQYNPKTVARGTCTHAVATTDAASA